VWYWPQANTQMLAGVTSFTLANQHATMNYDAAPADPCRGHRATGVPIAPPN